jgi:hypothetical protein
MVAGTDAPTFPNRLNIQILRVLATVDDWVRVEEYRD